MSESTTAAAVYPAEIYAAKAEPVHPDQPVPGAIIRITQTLPPSDDTVGWHPMPADLTEVRCPARTCRAEPGEPCITSTGLVRSEPHHLRWLATQTTVVKCGCANAGCERCHWTTFRPVDGAPDVD